MKREQISDEFKWDMSAIYPSLEAWEADYAKAAGSVDLIKSFQGTLGESAERLYEMQKCYDEINLMVEKLHVYANQHMHENTADAFYQGLAGRVQVLAVQLMEASFPTATRNSTVVPKTCIPGTPPWRISRSWRRL